MVFLSWIHLSKQVCYKAQICNNVKPFSQKELLNGATLRLSIG